MAMTQTAYDYQAIAPGYYDDVFHRNRGVQSKWHHLKFKHVRRQLPDSCSTLLDIGCGPGTFIGTLSESISCIGTDLASSQIEFAQAAYGTARHQFRCVGEGKLPFDDASFDAVTLIEIIEHLPEPVVRSVLQEARRVLRPGGKIVLTTPNYASFWPLLEKVVNARAPVTYENQHITFFTPRRLSQVLESLGFARSRVTTFQGAAPFISALNWKLADTVQNIENPLLVPGLGFLLLGTAFKA